MLGMNCTFILEGSGFVYGFMSLSERLFTGGIIMLIQKLTPDVSSESDTLGEYFRLVLGFACGSSTIGALIITFILGSMGLSKRQNDCSNDSTTFSETDSTENE